MIFPMPWELSQVVRGMVPISGVAETYHGGGFEVEMFFRHPRIEAARARREQHWRRLIVHINRRLKIKRQSCRDNAQFISGAG